MQATGGTDLLCDQTTQPFAASEVGKYVYPADLFAPSRLITATDNESPIEGDSSDTAIALTEAASDDSWWLVYTKSRQEKRLSEQLTRMRLPHYLPVQKREAITRGRVRLVEEPVFTGYLFLYADGEGRREALTTNRISTTNRVENGERLGAELAQIARSLADGARLSIESKIEPGDWARVKTGVYEGLEGQVLSRQGKTKLLLSVTFLKQGASMEIHDSLLETIDPPEMAGLPR
ncbi:Transcription antitermination protein RfaH [Pseudobythopirellula maris]|uniref:Transcription antitermination protein RfaH n=1 Tax=Pseudobythopirellula maris TaxID=2527991 RepID=A0A5C5ZQD6_9BACT|nr:transcription termination/antitermination NusG family protein [Pseudobythopirellula maris]TWT89724.1 Transcription antitermination protein RfaH [Pseudobythopirellula maris]